MIIDVAVLMILDALALWSLWWNRNTLDRWQIVRWAAFIVLVPLIGLLAYATWRFETSVERRGGSHASAPFLRSFDRDDR